MAGSDGGKRDREQPERERVDPRIPPAEEAEREIMGQPAPKKPGRNAGPPRLDRPPGNDVGVRLT